MPKNGISPNIREFKNLFKKFEINLKVEKYREKIKQKIFFEENQKEWGAQTDSIPYSIWRILILVK